MPLPVSRPENYSGFFSFFEALFFSYVLSPPPLGAMAKSAENASATKEREKERERKRKRERDAIKIARVIEPFSSTFKGPMIKNV